MIFLSEN